MASYGIPLIRSLQAKYLHRNSLCVTVDLTKAVAAHNHITSPVTMDSGTPTEFPLFPRLPLELRQMVWDEALPTLQLQRFDAEIAPHPNSTAINDLVPPASLVLCLTPTDDFVQLTSGYRVLLGACSESRRAAMAKIKCHLPIYYIARNNNDSSIVRSAKVPFNPDGHLCISGLGLSFETQDSGHCARGRIAEAIQCPAFHEIKNLAISMDWPPGSAGIRMFIFILGWEGDHFFDKMAKRMVKLETVALVDKRSLHDPHRLEAKHFGSLHSPAPVARVRGDGGDLDHEPDDAPTIVVPWVQLFDEFRKTAAPVGIDF